MNVFFLIPSIISFVFGIYCYKNVFIWISMKSKDKFFINLSKDESEF